MSLFITFEGGEGSGKSTQAEALYRRLVKLSIPAILTHEPGGTPLGEEITKLLKWGKNIKISSLTELLLFNASRAQLASDVLNPALKDGKVVVCDRYTDSTIAYQAYGRGLPLETVALANRLATGGLVPDLTVLIDVSVETGFERKKKEKSDRFQGEAKEFHERVRRGFLEIAAAEKERFLVIDGTKTVTSIADIIWQTVSGLLSYRGYKILS